MNTAGTGSDQKNQIEFDPHPFALIQTAPSLKIAFNKEDFNDKFISLACPIIVQNDIQNLLTNLWHSRAILLSQVINYRLNQPRINERSYHSDYVRQVAMQFQIDSWQEFTNLEQLFEMSLTGHLIRSIKSAGGCTSLVNLIQITEPFLPYLRKLNGKNFTVCLIPRCKGAAVRTVKGCLSAIVFKREGESQWSINECKVQEFVRQANEKLAQFFEKLKRNFPKFEEIRNYQQMRKLKKKRREDDKSLRPLLGLKLTVNEHEKISRKIQQKNLQLQELFQNQPQVQQSEKMDPQMLMQAQQLIEQQSMLRLQLEPPCEQFKNEGLFFPGAPASNNNSLMVDQNQNELRNLKLMHDFIKHQRSEMSQGSKEEQDMDGYSV